MDTLNSRINSQDTVILFADLQAGIVELTQTNPLDRLKIRIRALAKLAKLLDIPAIVSGIRGEDGSPAKVVSEIADGLGALPTYHRTTCDSFLNEEIERNGLGLSQRSFSVKRRGTHARLAGVEIVVDPNFPLTTRRVLSNLV